MKKQLAEVVDGTEIKEIIEQEILYSCENNGANYLCSTKNNATCGNGLLAVAESPCLSGFTGDCAENVSVLLPEIYVLFCVGLKNSVTV